MNVIEQNRDNYLRRSRSFGRIAAIVGGVVVFHLVLITAVANWHGWTPKPGEGLVRVNIVADKAGAPPLKGHSAANAP